MGKPHIAVLTPCFGNVVTAPYMTSVLKLFDACRKRQLGFTHLAVGGDAMITRARAEMVAGFLAIPGATHLLFVDADIVFEPQQAFRLLEFDADITAAAYPLKYLDWQKAAAAAVERRQDPESAALNYVVAPWEDAPQRRGDFVQVKHAGTGFLLVKRDALVKLCNAHPELRFKSSASVRQGDTLPMENRFALFDPIIDEDGAYLSEDYAFCLRWTRLGGEIWLDTRSRLKHIGQYTYSGDLSRDAAWLAEL